jgi:acetyl esterase
MRPGKINRQRSRPAFEKRAGPRDGTRKDEPVGQDMTPGGDGWKRLAAGVSLTWALLGLLWAQVIALPDPLLPPLFVAELLGDVPSATTTERFVVMVFKETSLLLCAFALVGLLLAAAAYGAGARAGPLLAVLLCAVTATVSLAPTAEARRTAASEGVPLSLPGYFGVQAPAPEHASETVTYARPGGEDLKLDVWRPPGDNGGGNEAEAGRPAVVVVHGGGWRSGSRGEFPEWNAWLADEGYVVFDIDYRLAPPPSWQDAPGDVRCAVAWVKENAGPYGVDPERVALMGRSAGGHLALLTAYTEASALPSGCEVRNGQDAAVAAVAAFYPPTDLAGLSSSGYLAGMDRFLGGTRRALPDRYRLLSPVERVDPGDPPTFLVHGGDDEIVPPGESELLAGRLREAGVPHRRVGLPWANHTFDFFWGGWGAQITRSSLEGFLDRWLEPPAEARDEPASPRGPS